MRVWRRDRRSGSTDRSRYWFPAKRYGWGWGLPARWQGWLVIALYVVLVGAGVVLITPGVRPAGADVHDQARIATPQQALADGADLLVVGRPITGATDPGAAAEQLRRALADG